MQRHPQCVMTHSQPLHTDVPHPHMDLSHVHRPFQDPWIECTATNHMIFPCCIYTSFHGNLFPLAWILCQQLPWLVLIDSDTGDWAHIWDSWDSIQSGRYSHYTTDGNIKALTSLLKQSRIVNKSIFEKSMVFVHGNLGSLEKMETIMHSWPIKNSALECMHYLLPIPGLFHVQMACIKQWATHWSKWIVQKA